MLATYLTGGGWITLAQISQGAVNTDSLNLSNAKSLQVFKLDDHATKCTGDLCYGSHKGKSQIIVTCCSGSVMSK